MKTYSYEPKDITDIRVYEDRLKLKLSDFFDKASGQKYWSLVVTIFFSATGFFLSRLFNYAIDAYNANASISDLVDSIVSKLELRILIALLIADILTYIFVFKYPDKDKAIIQFLESIKGDSDSIEKDMSRSTNIQSSSTNNKIVL